MILIDLSLFAMRYELKHHAGPNTTSINLINLLCVLLFCHFYLD